MLCGEEAPRERRVDGVCALRRVLCVRDVDDITTRRVVTWRQHDTRAAILRSMRGARRERVVVL